MAGRDAPNSIVERYRFQVSLFSRKAICERTFVRFSKLRRWLWEPIDETSNLPNYILESWLYKNRFDKRLNPLIEQLCWIHFLVFSVLENSVSAHLESPGRLDELLRGLKSEERGGILKVFCILLRLDLGRYILQLSDNIKDANLPISYDRHLESVFRGLADQNHSARSRAHQFYMAQHPFSPYIFGGGHHMLHKETITPICIDDFRNLTNSGGPMVRKVKVAGEFVDSELIKKVPEDALGVSQAAPSP
jgi:hypothetical protein